MSAQQERHHVEHVDHDPYYAWLFDMDGVITNTADVHAAAVEANV